MTSHLPNTYRRIIRMCGSIGIIGAIFFAIIIIFLGLSQPGYNHLIDTISVLVLGKYGWIQNINFAILSVSVLSLGIGLGLFFYNSILNWITMSFALLASGLIFDIIFQADPVDRTHIMLTSFHSKEGMIHMTITFMMVVLIPLLIIPLIRKLIKNKSTVQLGYYTILVIGLTAVFGFLWFYCRYHGIGFEVKGIWQKSIVLNVLIWIVIVGKWLAMVK